MKFVAARQADGTYRIETDFLHNPATPSVLAAANIKARLDDLSESEANDLAERLNAWFANQEPKRRSRSRK